MSGLKTIRCIKVRVSRKATSIGVKYNKTGDMAQWLATQPRNRRMLL